MYRWMVVTDTHRARIFETLRSADDMHEICQIINVPRREICASAATPSDTLRDNDFSGQIADFLRRERAAGSFDDLVLAAAPEWYETLRQQLHGSVVAMISSVIADDLTDKSPVDLLLQLQRAPAPLACSA